MVTNISASDTSDPGGLEGMTDLMERFAGRNIMGWKACTSLTWSRRAAVVSAAEQTGVDDERRTGDEACPVGREVENRVGDVLWFDPGHRQEIPGRTLCDLLGSQPLQGRKTIVHGRVHAGRVQRVHPNAIA